MISKINYFNSTLNITLLLIKRTKIFIKPGTHAYGNLSYTDPTSCILFLVVDMKKIVFVFRVFLHSLQQQFGMSTPVLIKSLGVFEYIASNNW